LSQKLTTKSIVLMSAAELQQTKELWISIMREKQLEMVPLGHAGSANLS